jgi:hypothetical protein
LSATPKLRMGPDRIAVHSNEIIEIPEEAYMKNGVYRPWSEEENNSNNQKLEAGNKEDPGKGAFNVSEAQK